MLDLKFVIENIEEVKIALRNRNQRFNELDLILELDNERRKKIKEVEQLKNQRNTISKEIGIKKSKGENVEELMEQSKKINKEIPELDLQLNEINQKIKEILLKIPNIPLKEVPIGTSEADNKIIKEYGDKKNFTFKPLAHWEIGEKLRIINFSVSAKLSGSRFALLSDKGAKLERGLINFMLDVHTTQNGYTEILPPFLVNEETMTGTGQLPKFKEDLFKCENYDLYLIPTGEVPLTNIHKDEILNINELPKYYTAYTPCFRSEAGSYGKDVRGLIRQHQFNKVELVIITTPEDGIKAFNKIVADAEKILQLLKLPYRIIELCTADLGFSSAKTYDLEVWMPGLNRYLEISSCSLCTDFQARRANIKFKRDNKSKPEYVYTLNGSGLAIGRTLAAIIENYQTEEGKIIIPDVLIDYLKINEI
ncbi:MAG TPA: serine--tRNA ligase [bacterium]|nr:serine--tRNA ligase [bacterium]HOL48550.1 serine--tRNA ligase [bacterium]HPQ19252.1 serine--tRNA ligase [bacterium]